MNKLSMHSLSALILSVLLFSIAVNAQPGRELTRDKTANPATQKRLALVIGNGGYKFVGPLANPVNDATDMAAALRKLGFEVISGTDQSKRLAKADRKKEAELLKIEKEKTKRN